MKVTFWGTRGSLPTPLKAAGVREKVLAAVRAAAEAGLSDPGQAEEFVDGLPFHMRGGYGGNTSCIQLDAGQPGYVICDAGSGLRDLGNHLAASGALAEPADYHIFLSHLHWDHIHGFPFFVPAYVPGNRVTIYACHPEAEKALRTQQDPPFFPVNLDYLGGDISFVTVEPGSEVAVEGFTARALLQDHPQDSYAWSFAAGGRRMVYATDSEHRTEADADIQPVLDFYAGADLVVFDAQYTFIDTIDTKQDWGHSSNIVGAELAVKAGVKRLCLFHHEPTSDDATLDKLREATSQLMGILVGTQRFAQNGASAEPPQVIVAYDGLVVEL